MILLKLGLKRTWRKELYLKSYIKILIRSVSTGKETAFLRQKKTIAAEDTNSQFLINIKNQKQKTVD